MSDTRKREKPLHGDENVIVQRIGENGPVVYAAPGRCIYIEHYGGKGVLERIQIDPSEQDELNAALWVARVVCDSSDLAGMIARAEVCECSKNKRTT